MTQTESVQAELIRRQRTAAAVVIAMILLTLALMLVGYLGKYPWDLLEPSVALGQGLWVAIAVFGIGSVALRRTMFSAMRLQSIAALRGIRGLLASLQRTTLLLAALGGFIAVMGFINTLMLLDWANIRNAGIIAIAVLLYAYPSRTAWQRVVHGIERRGDANDPPSPQESGL